MKIDKLLLTITTTTALCILSTTAFTANAKTPDKKYHAVIIQGAGYLPDTKKPEEGVDAITKATTKEINTYTLTTALTAKLSVKDIDVTVLQYTACKDLKCLIDGSQRKADLVIFAGPSYFSKQPPQLTKLYRKLEDVVKTNPKLICSTLIPAWYPDTKGKDSIKVAAKAFEKAGVRVVEGLSILTPRDKKKGAPTKEMDKALTAFAERLAAAVK